MEKTKESPKVEFIQGKSTYKMFIPQEVERKIRLICRNIWDAEWSGILFYKVKGEFGDGSLTIQCKDIFQMDTGSKIYTEFNMSPDIANYMIDHPELLEKDIYQGLIHSHNNMATFFSGTDSATLKEEGTELPHFVSLIVNNAGTYSAAVTRRNSIVEECREFFSYPSWGGKKREEIRAGTRNREVVEWYPLNIEIEGYSDEVAEEVLNRIKEVNESKKVTSIKTLHPSFPGIKGKEAGTYIPMGATSVEQNISYSKAICSDSEIPYDELKVDPEIIEYCVKQLITSSAIIPNDSGIDIEKWVRNIDTIYTERFGNLEIFEGFAANYLDFIISTTIDDAIMPLIDNDSSIMMAVVAYNIAEYFDKLPKNIWLNVYIELLDGYII